MSADLIDTTEMYLKTIFELEEDGVVPLRARIVERLGHSGPTVSQTVARMERDGLVTVREDRHLDLTPAGRSLARDVMRKHRLAERLLVDIIGMGWATAHEEACRWEHVMSTAVEGYLPPLLGDPTTDPYGNPVPGLGRPVRGEERVEDVAASSAEPTEVTISRIGEPIQAESGLLEEFAEVGVLPGARVTVVLRGGDVVVARVPETDEERRFEEGSLLIPKALAPHLFVLADVQPLL